MTNIDQLIAWFELEDTPTAAQFEELIRSLMHRTDGDKLALDRVDGLTDLLNGVATTQQVQDVANLQYRQVTQNSHGFVAKETVYYDGAVWLKAINNLDAETNDSFATCMVSEVIDANTFKVAGVGGIVQVDLGYAGAVALYQSQTVEGAVVTTQPTSGYVQHLGWYAGGVVWFNPGVPQYIGQGIYDQETDDYSVHINISGSRFEARIVIKDCNYVGTINSIVPAGIADQFDPDFFTERVLTNSDNETWLHEWRFSMLTVDSTQETVFSNTMDEVGDSKRVPLRDHDATEYSMDSSRLPDISDTAINVEFNFNSDAYTGDVSTEFILKGDLLGVQ